MKHLFIPLLVLLTISSIAQNARIGVQVGNMKNIPQSDERIIFRGQESGESFSGVTDSSGYFEIELLAGDVYDIQIENLGVSEEYSTISIPGLDPGQYFPFQTLTIQFEQNSSVTVPNLEFETGSATIMTASLGVLDGLADYLNRKEFVNLEIGGHTDNVGSSESNKRLSMFRAQSVKDYLVSKGIDPKRLVIKGYGESRPITTNETREGRQRNRRTELSVI